MPVHVSLFRGINVGGHRVIAMSALRSLHEELGFSGVTSYIQSGNVIFQSPRSGPEALASLIEKKVEETFGFPVTVVVRTCAALAGVIAKNPFAGRRDIDERRLAVMFLQFSPAPARVKKLAAAAPEGMDEFRVSGDSVYLYCPNGFGKTLLTNTFFEKQLEVGGTARNWKSVIAIRAMMSPPAATPARTAGRS